MATPKPPSGSPEPSRSPAANVAAVHDGDLSRLAAFTTEPDGGNPAGVWIGDRFPDDAQMQAIAADVGYSETVFATPRTGAARSVRYFSPLAEVPFCGHATIALGVTLGPGDDEATYRLATRSGEVGLHVANTSAGAVAALTSVEPSHATPPRELVPSVLGLLGWRHEELDDRLPPAIAYAGARHLVLAVVDRATLSRLDYDFDGLQRLMLDADLVTLQLVWRENASTYHARNPFPVGGVVEDPATGAAAAALGGYLRAIGLVDVPATVTIYQGADMGRPSTLTVTIPPGGGIAVAGHAIRLDG